MNTWILWRFGSWDRKHRKVIYCCPNKASSTLTVKLSSWSIHRAFGVMWPMQGNLRDGEPFSAEYFSLVSIRQSFFECIMWGTEQTCNVKLLFHLSLPQHNILLIMWEFHTMHPKNTCFPFLMDPPSHPCASPPKEKQNRQTNKVHQVQFELPVYSLEHGQSPSCQPLNKNWVPHVPHQKSSAVKSYTYYHCLKDEGEETLMAFMGWEFLSQVLRMPEYTCTIGLFLGSCGCRG